MHEVAPEEPVMAEEAYAMPEEPVVAEEAHAAPEEPVVAEEAYAMPEEPVMAEEAHAAPEEPVMAEDYHEERVENEEVPEIESSEETREEGDGHEELLLLEAPTQACSEEAESVNEDDAISEIEPVVEDEAVSVGEAESADVPEINMEAAEEEPKAADRFDEAEAVIENGGTDQASIGESVEEAVSSEESAVDENVSQVDIGDEVSDVEPVIEDEQEPVEEAEHGASVEEPRSTVIELMNMESLVTDAIDMSQYEAPSEKGPAFEIKPIPPELRNELYLRDNNSYRRESRSLLRTQDWKSLTEMMRNVLQYAPWADMQEVRSSILSELASIYGERLNDKEGELSTYTQLFNEDTSNETA